MFYSQDAPNAIILDSIDFYLTNSKNSSIAYNTKLGYAFKAQSLAQIHNIDSLLVKSYINIASLYSEENKSNLFIQYSHKALSLAKRNNDQNSLALANKTLGYYYYDKMVDSAYYYNTRAEKLYRNLNDNYNMAVVLLDIASLQYSDKDFTGSELTSVKGLSLLDQLAETRAVIRYKARFYNLLGLVFKRLEQYEESIDYLKRTIQLYNKINIDTSEIGAIYNNLANTYRVSGKYDLAIDYYNTILSNDNLINEDPDLYILAKDNYAYTLFLSKDFSQLPKLYFDVLHLSDSLGFYYNTVAINKHLSEYYQAINKKDSAIYFAYKFKNVSEKYFKDDLLEALRMLSKLENDSIAKKHYEAYINLSDSLVKNERAIRNKFGRIQYETDELEQENIQIAKERMWLLIISVILIIASFLLYIIINQRNKNKELKFIQQQQEANEEIYNLMLSQHENIEEARALEKKRVSQELHDGVLGRLFGTRLSLDSLNMNTSNEAIKTRSQYIDQLKDIEQDIRKVSHELNTDFVSGSGFKDIINTLVDTQSELYGLTYTINHNDAINWDEISNKNKIHIYRIIQESLHNIYKHAQATKVKISFKLKNNVICLTITDNGSGFDVDKAKSGIGLKNMNSRIKEIEGEINISSKKGKGTVVAIEVPIN